MNKFKKLLNGLGQKGHNNMSGENNTPENKNANPTLSQHVDNLRTAARDILRMKAINNILDKILHLNIKLDSWKKKLETVDKPVEIAQYSLDKLDPEHPDIENMTKDKEAKLKQVTEEAEITRKELESSIKKAEEKVTQYQEDIKAWESGEKKVDKYDLSDMTSRLIDAEVNKA